MHTEWTDLLSAYLDGELAPAAARRLEAHLAGCPECRRVQAELEAVVGWAARYEGRLPDRDPWPAIRAAIEERRVVAWPARAAAGSRFSWRQLIAASLVMAAAGAGGAWLAMRNGGPAVTVEAAAPAEPGAVAAAAGPEDLEIRDLEQLLASGRAVLDTATVRIVEESLRLIDEAIADAREAIQRDSTKAYLNGRIAAQMRQKLAILKMATRAIGAET